LATTTNAIEVGVGNSELGERFKEIVDG